MKEERIRFEGLRKPYFIVLEGIKGSGKSTQEFRLKKLFENDKDVISIGRTYSKEKSRHSIGESLGQVSEHLEILQKNKEKTQARHCLSEGGFSSIIAYYLTQSIPLDKIKQVFFNIGNRMHEFSRKHGYLEIILIPEDDTSDMSTALKMFKSSSWGAFVDSEVIEINEKETILDITKRIKELLKKYGIELED